MSLPIRYKGSMEIEHVGGILNSGKAPVVITRIRVTLLY